MKHLCASPVTRQLVRILARNSFSTYRKCLTQIPLKQNPKFEKRWLFENINSYGALRIDCPMLTTVITSIDVDTVPLADKGIVILSQQENLGHVMNDVEFDQILQLTYEKDTNLLAISLREDSSGSVIDLLANMTLSIEIPHSYDVTANVRSASISNLQNDSCSVSCLSGACNLEKMKVANIHVRSESILCEGSLYGSGSLKSSGAIRIVKLQGLDFELSSTTGGIFIESIYAHKFSASSSLGNIDIGTINANCTNMQSSSADIHVSSVSGDLALKSESGNINVTVECAADVSIATQSGDVTIGVSEDWAPSVQAEASFVDVPAEMVLDGLKRTDSSGRQFFEGNVGDGRHQVEVKSDSGVVSFVERSWLSKFM